MTKTSRGVSQLTLGPFNSEFDACKAFAAAENREESPARFLASLHPSVSLLIFEDHSNKKGGTNTHALKLESREKVCAI